MKRLWCWLFGHKWEDVTGFSAPFLFTANAVYRLNLGSKYFGYKFDRVCSCCNKVSADGKGL